MTRQVTISPVLNGFMLHVGCQTVVFESAKKMLDELGQYYAAPDAVEHRFIKNAVNKTMLEPVPPVNQTNTLDCRLTVGAAEQEPTPAGRPC
jgi:hypothetical protein